MLLRKEEARGSSVRRTVPPGARGTARGILSIPGLVGSCLGVKRLKEGIWLWSLLSRCDASSGKGMPASLNGSISCLRAYGEEQLDLEK